MKVTVETKVVNFDFEKYVNYMLVVAPIYDVLGIKQIEFKDTFSNPKSDPESLACYLRGINGNSSTIEINVSNIIKENKIPVFLFNHHPEIAALWLSEIVFHEIGHHVHAFKRHGIKHNQHEKFAGQYGEAGYCNYLLSRKDKIISSYKWGTRNILEVEKENRQAFKHNLNSILEWLETNTEKVNYPKSNKKKEITRRSTTLRYTTLGPANSAGRLAQRYLLKTIK